MWETNIKIGMVQVYNRIIITLHGAIISVSPRVIKGLVSNSYMPSRSNHLLDFYQKMQKPQPAKSSSSLKNLLKAYMAKNNATPRNLENQMGQLANELRNRPQGALPSDTENPRNTSKEQCKIVTLRSGKELEIRVVEAKGEPVVVHNQKKVQPEVETPIVQIPVPVTPTEPELQQSSPEESTPTVNAKPTLLLKICHIKVKTPSPSYPQRFQKQ